jgi:hypothetical protein
MMSFQSGFIESFPTTLSSFEIEDGTEIKRGEALIMSVPKLEVSDIQATILRPRPSPYKGEYVVIRIDEVAQGREMLHRIIPYITPAEERRTPSITTWLGIAFTYSLPFYHPF